MKKLLLLIPLLLSCKHTAPVDGGTTPVGALVQCGKQEFHDAEINLIPTVTTILSSAGWEASLVSLAATWGYDIINCVVRYVVGTSHNARAMAPGDDLAKAREDNGNEWLVKQHVQFAQ